MGAQSRLIQLVSAIKSGDVVAITAMWPNATTIAETIRYDEQSFDDIVKVGYGQLLIKVDESHWPKSLPRSWGVGTEFPDIEFEVTWKNKVCKFRHSCNTAKYDLTDGIMPFPTYQYYIYEDGIHVGPEPTGFFWGKYKDKRRIIQWKLRD